MFFSKKIRDNQDQKVNGGESKDNVTSFTAFKERQKEKGLARSELSDLEKTKMINHERELKRKIERQEANKKVCVDYGIKKPKK